MSADMENPATVKMKVKKERLMRTTIFLPNAMARNLAALALQTGDSQAGIIRQALAAYMKKAGYDPYKQPRIKVSH